MKTPGALRAAAWAAAGAALLGSGMFLGFVTAALKRKEGSETEAAPGLGPSARLDSASLKRIDELASAVTELQSRLEGASLAPEVLEGRLEAVNERVEKLERRIEQLTSETPSIPFVDQVLVAVEDMVAKRIAGLDERLTDQVHAIDLLRNASRQTDELLQKLVNAVEALAEQTSEKEPKPSESAAPQQYPIA